MSENFENAYVMDYLKYDPKNHAISTC